MLQHYVPAEKFTVLKDNMSLQSAYSMFQHRTTIYTAIWPLQQAQLQKPTVSELVWKWKIKNTSSDTGVTDERTV